MILLCVCSGEDLNRRGAQQRRKMQIQIRAEQVLQ